MESAANALGSIAGAARHLFFATVVPALVLVSALAAMAALTDGFTSAASAANLWSWLQRVEPGWALIAGGAALVLGLVLRPLVFTATQVLEGYWGTSQLAGALMSWRVGVQRGRFDSLQEILGAGGHSPSEADEREKQGKATTRLDLTKRRQRASYLRGMEARRLMGRWPEAPDLYMPTRLGNALRRSEARAGRPYSLNAVQMASRLLLVAPRPVSDHVNNTRTQLDASVSFVVVWTVTVIASLMVFASDGWWLLTALAAFGFAALSYRGAVEAARRYGDALEVAFDLGRFQLYAALGLPLPATTEDERANNGAVRGLISLRRSQSSVTYSHSP